MVLYFYSIACFYKQCILQDFVILRFINSVLLCKAFCNFLCSVAQSCPTLCNPMNHSTPGLPVHHQLPEFTQTHVHWVGNADISSSVISFNLSQHQGLYKWVSSSHQVTEVLELQLQHHSFPYSGLISFRMDWLDLLAVQGLSRVFSNTTAQKHQFFSTQASLWSHSCIYTWPLEKP